MNELEYIVFRYNDGANRTKEINEIFEKYKSKIPYKEFRDEVDAKFGFVSSIFMRIILKPDTVKQIKELEFYVYEIKNGIVYSSETSENQSLLIV